MVREVYLALAALGGHLGRRGDGPPGWQTLWLGRATLRLLVEGAHLAAQLRDDEPQHQKSADPPADAF